MARKMGLASYACSRPLEPDAVSDTVAISGTARAVRPGVESNIRACHILGRKRMDRSPTEKAGRLTAHAGYAVDLDCDPEADIVSTRAVLGGGFPLAPHQVVGEKCTQRRCSGLNLG